MKILNSAIGLSLLLCFFGKIDSANAATTLSLNLVEAGVASEAPISGFSPIDDNANIILSTLPTKNLSIFAKPSSATGIGSVYFSLDGSYSHLEHNAPYSLCGDSATAAICPQLDVVGKHSLTVTAHSGLDQTTPTISTATISFTVSASGPTLALDLVEAEVASEAPISGFNPIAKNANIVLSSLPSKNLSIFAKPSSSSGIGSVYFSLDRGSYTHLERNAPYSLCGDSTTAAACPQLDVAGTHTLTVSAHSGLDQTTPTISTTTISFIVSPGTSSSHSVNIGWSASTSSVSGYNVYRGTASGGPYTKVNSKLVTTLNYTDSTVAGGKTYDYVTTAVNSSGKESTNSNQVTVSIP